MKACLLVYDVPSGKRDAAHPSTYLWRFGVPINLSAWVVPQSRVAMLPTHEWDAARFRWRIVRFDEDESGTVLAVAREALVSELDARRRALTRGIAALRDQYQELASNDVDGLRKVDRLGQSHLRRARKRLEDAAECAAAFGITGNVREVMDGLRAYIKGREALAFQWSTAKRRNMTLAAAPEAQQVAL